MNKFFMLLAGMGLWGGLLYGQAAFTLSGVVADDNNTPLVGASVLLFPVAKGTVTDVNGHFLVADLPRGHYSVEISFVGFATLRDTLTLASNRIYNARLKPSLVSLQEVVVTDHYAETRKREESLNIEVVNHDYLKQNLGGSLMKSLERLPGVTTLDIGSGQSKPVIRGLGFNRVVVLENNIKHEAQQWGADHGLEIDQYAVDNVEVLKGPASLMVGSDAIGGVIDIKNRMLPAENTFGATVDLTGKSNNDFAGASVSMYGRKGRFYANFRATLVDYADYKVPTDSVDIYSYRAALYRNHLRNTAGSERDLHLTLGMFDEGFQSKLFISSVRSKSGFFANAHGLEPRNVDAALYDDSSRDIHFPWQSVHHFKVSNSTQIRREAITLTADLGFQRNFRQEWSQYVSHGYMPAVFPDSLLFNPDLERQFDKDVFSGNVRLSHQTSEKMVVTAGISSELHDNRIEGRGFIVPAYRQWSAGGFALVKYSFTGKRMLQGGIRYDYGRLQVESYSDWFPTPVIVNGDTSMVYLERAGALNRHFSSFTWSVGYTHQQENWSYRANVGRSFRMPIAKELAANGVNYHHFSYEVGNPGLAPEVSYQLDAGAEFSGKRIAMGFTPFVNYFSNYIYLNPTSEHDRLYGNGNQVFRYTQSEVFRIGAEIHAHYQIINSVQLGVVGEWVSSRQLTGEKKGFSLPFSPPASAVFNVKYQPPKLKLIENGYVSIDVRFTAPQNDVVPPEETTGGYQVVNLSLGGDLKFGNRTIDLSFQVQNLFNIKYFNHTSYYRLINVPEPGRNVVVNISIPFSGHFKE